MLTVSSGSVPDVIVLRERNARLHLGCGGLALLWASLIAGFAWLSSDANLNLPIYTVSGVFLVVTVLAWIGGSGWWRLDVGRDAIATRSGPRHRRITLTGDKNDTLRIIPDGMLYGKRPSGNSLIALGTGAFVSLRTLSLDEVRRACTVQGWRFDGDTALAARDVRCYLRSGKTRQAVPQAARVTDLFGPFPGAAADGRPHLALAAAVFEAYGDSINHTQFTFDGHHAAYKRAICEQKAFAGTADSEAERTARDAEVLRLEKKNRAASP